MVVQRYFAVAEVAWSVTRRLFADGDVVGGAAGNRQPSSPHASRWSRAKAEVLDAPNLVIVVALGSALRPVASDLVALAGARRARDLRVLDGVRHHLTRE